MKKKHVELEAPPSGPITWAGWARMNPNRVARVSAKLWFDARQAIMRDLGVVDLGEVEVVRAED